MTPEIKQRIQQIRQGKTPKGYKKTKEGIIPDEWGVYQLSQVMGELESGTSVNSDVSNDTGIYVLKTSSIHDGIVDIREAKPVIKSDFDRLKCNLQTECILISRMNTPELVGACGYSKNSSSKHYLPDRLWQAHNTSDAICNFIYLNYLLNTDRYQTIIKSLATGTSNSMKNISKEMFLNITIPLPPLPEQTVIAEILSTQDRVIELKEHLLAEKKRQKKYLMQQLLTGKKRLKGFKGEWKRCKLGEVCILNNGRAYKQNELLNCGKYKVLRVGNLFTNDEWYYSDLELSPDKYIDEGDLIYAWSASFRPYIWKGDKVIYHYHIWKITNIKDIQKEYLYLYLLLDVEKLQTEKQGGTMAHITKENMENREILVPATLPEQTAIAEILSTADREIELIGQSIEAEKRKKKSLMQLLLTGIVRVK